MSALVCNKIKLTFNLDLRVFQFIAYFVANNVLSKSYYLFPKRARLQNIIHSKACFRCNTPFVMVPF